MTLKADAADSTTSVATEKSKPLVSNDDSSYLKKNPLPSAVQTSADRPVPTPMETQGHVSANTDVDSPDSLRSLVSRTQKAPEDYPQAETKKVTPASEPSQGETDAVGVGTPSSGGCTRQR